LFGIELANLLQDREAIHPRHFQIKHHDIRPFSAKEIQTLLTTVSEDHVIALPTEERVEEVPDALLIINHKNLGHVTSQKENGYIGRDDL
jgi:hypothetical protein